MNDTMFDAFFNDPNSPYYVKQSETSQEDKMPMQPLHVTEEFYDEAEKFVVNNKLLGE